MKADLKQSHSIEYQLMWNRLLAVVEEQGQSLIRTAFSSMVRECGDISAGVFDSRGRMLAQAVTGTPGHVNTMAESVLHFMEKFPPETMRPGDVFLTNDPWMGTGHLNDLVVAAPVFRGTALVGMVSCTSHLIDIGGIGFGPDGKDVYMEGLNIPMLRVVSEGKVNETVLEMIRANSRLPIESEGDVYSLIACSDTGNRRLQEMMEEFGVDTLDPLGDYIIARSRDAVLEKIAELPAGQFESSLTIDGFDEPITLRLTLTIESDKVTIDYTGTDSVSSFGINVPLTYTKAYSCFALGCAISPGIPNNSGSLDPYVVTAPTGTIVNAPRPLAVATRHVIGQILPDAVFGALRQAIPDKVPAEGTSCLWNIILRSMPGSQNPFTLMAATNGGTGARPIKDGLSATAFPSGVKGTPIEILESTNPILVWQKDLRPDSCGHGQFRGGLGQDVEIENRAAEPMELLAAYDRIDNPPRGFDAGKDGSPGYVGLSSGTALRSKGTQTIPAGERLVLKTPGGAGLGDARSRDRAKVEADVVQGIVSAETARTIYGHETE